MNDVIQEMREYADLNNFFVVNGKEINKFKNLEENNIKNGDIIEMKQK